MRPTLLGSGRKAPGGSQLRQSGCSVLTIITWVFIGAWCLFLGLAFSADVFDHKQLQEEKSLRGASPGTAKQEEKAAEELHVIFSTDCTPYQDWQTLVLFHSATVVGQVGPITRIASGCDEAKKAALTRLYQQLYPQYHVHFTPDFKKDAKTQKSYDFYNKPWGLKHWLEYAQPPVPSDVIVALIDPDMVFLRPLTTAIRGADNNIFDKSLPPGDVIDRVAKGRPVAQLYGLGAPWANDRHLKFNRTRICGAGSRCLLPDMAFGDKHYSVGPPYLVHREDLQRIANTWTAFVPRVYEGYPYLLAEMYAYSMAAAHEALPHLQVRRRPRPSPRTDSPTPLLLSPPT